MGIHGDSGGFRGKNMENHGTNMEHHEPSWNIVEQSWKTMEKAWTIMETVTRHSLNLDKNSANHAKFMTRYCACHSRMYEKGFFLSTLACIQTLDAALCFLVPIGRCKQARNGRQQAQEGG